MSDSQLREAEKPIELAKAKSWGGRKVQANIAHFSSNRTVRRTREAKGGLEDQSVIYAA